jgi:hypothetical protein
MAMTIAGVIALMLAMGIFVYFFLFEFGPFAGEGVSREACRDSVLLRAQGKILGATTFENLACETHDLEIKNSDEDEIKSELSNEMYDCWYQFGEGKKDFLTRWDLGTGDNYCFICSRIEFSEKIQEEIPQFGGLMKYLATEPLPFKKDQTLFDYIYTDTNIAEVGEDDMYNTTEPLYVAFFADKKTKWEAIDKILSGTLLCAGGVVVAVSSVGFGTPGAVIACAAGSSLIVAGAASKTGFISGMYVGNAGEAISACNQ